MHNYTLDVLKDYNKEGYYPKLIAKKYNLTFSPEYPHLQGYIVECLGVLSSKELLNKGRRAAERIKAWDKCVSYTRQLKAIADLLEIHDRFIMVRQQERNMRLDKFKKERERGSDYDIDSPKLTETEKIDIIKSIYNE